MSNPKVNQEASQLISAYIDGQSDFSHDILVRVRKIILDSNPNMLEDWKWGAPNFNLKGMICWLVRFKDHVGINFFKGVLIPDEFQLFSEGKEDEKGNRIIKFQALSEVNEQQLNYYLQEAIRINLEEIKIPKKLIDTGLPAYLEKELSLHPAANTFFQSLSPGGQRDYIEWITEAKREATRDKRMVTMMEWLAEGKRKNWKYENC